MLKKADKKEFVEKLFDISVFEDMYKLVHKDSLALEKESLACQNRIMVLNKSNDDYEARMNAYEESRKAKLEAISSHIAELEKAYSTAKNNESKSNSVVVSKLEAAITKLRESYDYQSENARSLQMKMNNLDVGMHKLDESKSSRENAVSKHKDILEKLCNDCKPVFMQHYSLDKMLDEIASINIKKAALQKSKDEISGKCNECIE